jgi:hypothetical protein
MLSSHLYHSMIVLGKCHSTPVLASQIPPLQDHALFLQPRANNIQYYIKDMTLGLTPLCVLNSSSPFLVCVCSYHCLFIPLEVHVCSRGRHIYLPPNVTITILHPLSTFELSMIRPKCRCSVGFCTSSCHVN